MNVYQRAQKRSHRGKAGWIFLAGVLALLVFFTLVATSYTLDEQDATPARSTGQIAHKVHPRAQGKIEHRPIGVVVPRPVGTPLEVQP